jgi:hypothetical protein
LPGTVPGCLSKAPRRTLLLLHCSMGSCARPRTSACLWLSLVHAVFAGCRQSLLVDGPSRHYPCTPCVGAWTHTPPSQVGALALFFPTDLGLALRETRSAKRNYPCYATSTGSCLSGLQSFASFRLLRSLGPRIAPTAPPHGNGQLIQHRLKCEADQHSDHKPNG